MIKALIIGVSDYFSMNQHNLLFCKNDIYAISKALIDGLKVDVTNITICGEKEIVYEADFLVALNNFILNTTTDDTLIFYFSGHGGSSASGHCLLLSDGYVLTNDIIEVLEKSISKNKIIFLDCCESGNFSIDTTAKFEIKRNKAQYIEQISEEQFSLMFRNIIQSQYLNSMKKLISTSFMQLTQVIISLQKDMSLI